MYAGVPPFGVSVTVPSLPPLQETFVATAFAVGFGELVSVALVVAVHPLASVTVTVYVPAKTFVKS